MDLQEFIAIQDINERANLLWHKGMFLDERIVYNKSKHLIFTLFNFYVEIIYDLKTDTLTHVKPLETLEDWEGYLGSINLEHLLK